MIGERKIYEAWLKYIKGKKELDDSLLKYQGHSDEVFNEVMDYLVEQVDKLDIEGDKKTKTSEVTGDTFVCQLQPIKDSIKFSIKWTRNEYSLGENTKGMSVFDKTREAIHQVLFSLKDGKAKDQILEIYQQMIEKYDWQENVERHLSDFSKRAVWHRRSECGGLTGEENIVIDDVPFYKAIERSKELIRFLEHKDVEEDLYDTLKKLTEQIVIITDKLKKNINNKKTH